MHIFSSMQMMPAHMQQMMQQQAGPPKPLFPSAIPTSSSGGPIVGTDFKPISSGLIFQFFYEKWVYTKKYLIYWKLIKNIKCLAATISAPPTTNLSAGSNSEGNKVSTIATSSATSKIIHPSEDTSLEEIRARHSKYSRNIPSKTDDGPSSSSNAASEVNNDLYSFIDFKH